MTFAALIIVFLSVLLTIVSVTLILMQRRVIRLETTLMDVLFAHGLTADEVRWIVDGDTTLEIIDPDLAQ